MKKLTIIGLLIIIVAAFGLLQWRHVKIAEFDTAFRQNLGGIWLREEDNMRCTNAVAADGSFVELSWFSHSDRTNTYRRTGRWIVKNEHLIETIKTSTNPSEITPHTGNPRIISADASAFILRWPNSTNQVWQKISQ